MARADGDQMTDLAKVADTIERQFCDPSVPPRWDDFSDDDWKSIAKALRSTLAPVAWRWRVKGTTQWALFHEYPEGAISDRTECEPLFRA